MSEVKSVSLQINAGSTSSKTMVTVSYKLAFTSSEAGKKYKVAISLFGEDLPGDKPAPQPSFGGPQPFYTFAFPSSLPLAKFTTVTAQAGEMSFSEWRELDTALLNEDPGFEWQYVEPGIKFPKANADEIYARVSLANEARSSTVNMVVF